MARPVQQSAFADALTDAAMEPPPGLTTARGVSDAARFAVYRNNVVAGLGKALEQRFPVVRRLVGDDFFKGMARAFIAAHRPRTPLLAEYGDDLPGFIEAFAPAANVTYLADMARLEAAWTRAYHAADVAPLAVTGITTVSAEALPELRLLPHPSAMLLTSRWPIGSIWAAHQSDEVKPVGHLEPETVLIVRPDAEVSVHILPAQDIGFATALFDCEPLGVAAERAASANPAFDFGTALVGLIGLGAFMSIVPSTQEHTDD